MSKSQLNILRFLQGEASPEEMKKLQKWAAKSPDNESGIQLSQSIFSEASELSSYRRVDTNVEWDAFKQLTKTPVVTQVSDLELLHYADGTADYALRKKINSWGLESPANQKDINNLTAINTAITGLADYKDVDINGEYTKFQTATKAQKASKITPITAPKAQAAPKEAAVAPGPAPVTKKGSTIPMWIKYAAAACVAVMMVATVLIWDPAPKTLTYATADTAETLLLSDGTSVNLGPSSTLTYFADVDKVKTREVDLQGTGSFKVRSMADKPFTASTNDQVGVTVLGTVFEIDSSPEYDAVISTLEGQVKAFDVKNPAVSTIVNAGESVGFSSDGFAQIIEEVVAPDTRKEYSVIKVLDYLMENSNWKVTSGPSQSFGLNSKVLVDLDQSYIEIIEYLKTAGYLDYRKRSCQGCYEITSFIGE